MIDASFLTHSQHGHRVIMPRNRLVSGSVASRAGHPEALGAVKKYRYQECKRPFVLVLGHALIHVRVSWCILGRYMYRIKSGRYTLQQVVAIHQMKRNVNCDQGMHDFYISLCDDCEIFTSALAWR